MTFYCFVEIMVDKMENHGIRTNNDKNVCLYGILHNLFSPSNQSANYLECYWKKTPLLSYVHCLWSMTSNDEKMQMFIYKWCLCIKNPSFINENSKSIIPCCPVAFINKHAIWFYIEIRLNLVPTSNMDVFYTDLHLSHCNCLRFWTLKSK